VLRAYHDDCEEVPNFEAIHVYEDACAAAECNTAPAAFDPNTCGSAGTVPSFIASPSNVDNTGLIVGLSVVCFFAVMTTVAAIFFKQQSKARANFATQKNGNEPVFVNQAHLTA
jgi:hypothetical protein